MRCIPMAQIPVWLARALLHCEFKGHLKGSRIISYTTEFKHFVTYASKCFAASNSIFRGRADSHRLTGAPKLLFCMLLAKKNVLLLSFLKLLPVFLVSCSSFLLSLSYTMDTYFRLSFFNTIILLFFILLSSHLFYVYLLLL